MTTEQLQATLANPVASEAITALKAHRTPTDLAPYTGEFQLGGHKILNTALRLDKPIKDAEGKVVRMEKVNRIALALQEIITERAVSFLFGSPVNVACEPQNDKQTQVLKALKRILKDNKMDSFSQEIALELFRTTEVAECWFPVQREEHSGYGFKTSFKLRVMAFNPSEGNELYPLFDPTGDLIAFSRAFSVQEAAGVRSDYFETYTAPETIVWRKESGADWTEVKRTPNPIGKIPIVYARQPEVEWAGVQNLIERLEKLLSNYGDTIDYHGSPTILVKGKVTGWADKGESGKLIQMDNGADASYLTWNQAPEMVKLEIDTLIKHIYSLSQTPDISFEAVKGLGQTSGAALRMLFLDAHLKVKKKQRIFDAYLDRRVSIVKAFVGAFNIDLKTEAETMEIDSIIQPFMVDDVQELITRLTTANGGQALISQKTATKLSGLVDDVEGEYEQLQEEESARSLVSITEPTF